MKQYDSFVSMKQYNWKQYVERLKESAKTQPKWKVILIAIVAFLVIC